LHLPERLPGAFLELAADGFEGPPYLLMDQVNFRRVGLQERVGDSRVGDSLETQLGARAAGSAGLPDEPSDLVAYLGARNGPQPTAEGVAGAVAAEARDMFRDERKTSWNTSAVSSGVSCARRHQ
jgi:hypothetical protein